MSTKALDVSTIFHALSVLEAEFLGKERKWRTHNPTQEYLFELYAENKKALELLKGLIAKASTDWTVLNAFLQEHGFDPMFERPLDGIGAVSILDMMVKWLNGAFNTTIHSDRKDYPGFEIPHEGHETFECDHMGFEWMTSLKTESGDSLWLAMPDQEPRDAEDLLTMAFSAMECDRRPKELVSTVSLPEVEFDIKPDLGFLIGADTTSNSGEYWYVSEAHQQFKFRMNKEGARAKVATGIGMLRGGVSNEPRPLIFYKPFLGWFTQKAAPTLPIAVFYADRDSWKKAGDLDSL